MKKTLIAIVCVSLLLIACGNQKNEEISKLAEVIKIHDKVMADDELLVKDKLTLDSLAKIKTPGIADTVDEKARIKMIDRRLGAAEVNMENWMHQFDAEQKGKSHQQIMDYLAKQKQQITAVDTQLNNAVLAAKNYLKTVKHK